jgi:hypothetical protein
MMVAEAILLNNIFFKVSQSVGDLSKRVPKCGSGEGEI